MDTITARRLKWSDVGIVILAALLIPTVYGSDDATSKAIDPWFSESATIGAETVEVEASLPTAKNPRALYRIALDRYDKTPENAISKRIAILEQAITVYPSDPKGLSAVLSELKAKKTQVLEAIDQAGQTSQEVESALRLIVPHADILSTDPSLLVAFLNSNFARQFERQIERLGEAQDLDTLVEVAALLKDSGISKTLGQRFHAAIREALASLVAAKWLPIGSTQLPGENYLAGQLLADPNRKLTVRLEFPADAPENLKRNLIRSFQRNWNKDFHFLPPEAPEATDFVLKVETEGIVTEEDVEATLVPSTVPGHVKEEPNPEFMELVKKYEKAAERYEVALNVYESEYERYIENAEDEEWNRAQRDLTQAEAIADPISPIPCPGGPGIEYETAQANLQVARAVASSTTSTTTPEPMKPRPVHLDILNQLYHIPSTIVTSEEATPYEYTKKTLNYLLRAHATVELVSDSIRVSRPIQLQQERIWTQNEGVAPNDPAVGPGDFSVQELNSAIDLFSLAFGSDCAKAFTSMLAEARAAANPGAFRPEELPKVTLAMALQAQETGTKKLTLSPEEVQQLAALAENPGMSPTAFRSHCLALVTERLGAAPKLSREQIESQLR